MRLVLRWVWYVGIPLVVATLCAMAAIGSVFFKDEPAHIALAYAFGVIWFLDQTEDGTTKWEKD